MKIAPEKEPVGVVVTVSGTHVDTKSKYLTGTWVRCWPENAHDVFKLQAIPHNTKKFTPLNGDGILVSTCCL